VNVGIEVLSDSPALKEGLLPALQTDSVRIPSSEFSGPLLAALNRHIDNAQDEIKKDLRDFRNKLKVGPSILSCLKSFRLPKLRIQNLLQSAGICWKKSR
jgi:hypothetical protein